ncbi:MAG: flippase [archaeon]
MKNESTREKFTKNSFWSLSSSIFNRIGTLIFTIIIVRILNPDGYGIYSLVLSIAMIFYTFSDLGINTTFQRYTAEALVQDRKKIAAYHRYLLKVKLFLSLITSILFLILAYPISMYFFKNTRLFLPMIVAAFYIFVLSFEGFYSQVFYSIEKVKYLTAKEFLNQSLRILLVISVFFFVASNYHVVGIFVTFILISLILILYSTFFIKKLLPTLFFKSKEKVDKRRIKRFIGYLVFASISGVFFSYIDSVMLGFFLLPEYVGFYRAAFSLIAGIAGLLAFPNVILLPIFTKIKKYKIEVLFNEILRYLLILTIPAAFGLAVLGNYFLALLYGDQYLNATLPLYFLSFLMIPMIAMGSILPLFTAKEKPKTLAELIILTSILNILLNFVFIKVLLSISPLWATAGAAIATLLTWIFYLIAASVFAKKQLKVVISFKPFIKPLIASIVMAAAIIYANTLIQDLTLILGIGEVVLGVIVYFTLMLLIKGFKKSDLDLLKSILKK